MFLLAGPWVATARAQVSVPGNYPTIQAAIDAVPSGTTISVQPGTYAEALIIANTSRSITIRGVGGAAQTIVDAAGRGQAAINVFQVSGTIKIHGLTFRNAAVPGNISGGGFVINAASPAFVDCVFESNSAFNGGGGALINSNATFNDCIIRNNTAQHFGGGVYIVDGSRPVFTACEITGNESGTGGAGVGNNGAGGGWFSSDSGPIIRGGRISNNTSRFAAGGVFHFGTFGAPFGVSPLLMEDVEISGNVSVQFSPSENPSEGGGMHVEDNVAVTLQRVRVLNNRANTGAGLNAYRGRYDIVDSVIEGNIAPATAGAPSSTGFGGGIAATSNNPGSPQERASIVHLTRTLVRGNTAVLAAGGIGVFGDNFSPRRATLSLVDSVVLGNSSQSQGGGIHVNRTDASIGNTLIIGNAVSGGAAPFGGGILIGTAANLTLGGSTVAANAAGLNGGGIFMDDGANLNMTQSRIYANTASNGNGFGGGGLFVGPNGNNTGTIENSIIADNTQYQIFENLCPKTRLTYNNNTITPRQDAPNELYVTACSPFQIVTNIADFNALGNTSGNNSNVPRYVHFLAAPPVGVRSTLAWSAARATTVTIAGVANFSASTGSTDVAPGAPTNYSLTAAAPGGNYGPVVVAVAPVAPPAGAPFVPGDFNGDGRADIGLFRPSNGFWYVQGIAQLLWGGGNDIPLSGDFDGDDKADAAVFRPSTGIWYVRSSITGGLLQYAWGGAGDIPVPADYDGDGRTDVAIFRPSDGGWYILFTRTYTTALIPWGGGGDIPVQADYNGDGVADIAVFRPSNGTWYIRGFASPIQWGGLGDVPVPGDYDGDGRGDIGVFRPSASAWYVFATGTGAVLQYGWGGSGDTAVPGDYDGDGKTDVAIFRPSAGIWQIRQSGNGALAQYSWGGGGDLPVLRR